MHAPRNSTLPLEIRGIINEYALKISDEVDRKSWWKGSERRSL